MSWRPQGWNSSGSECGIPPWLRMGTTPQNQAGEEGGESRFLSAALRCPAWYVRLPRAGAGRGQGHRVCRHVRNHEPPAPSQPIITPHSSISSFLVETLQWEFTLGFSKQDKQEGMHIPSRWEHRYIYFISIANGS